MTWLVVITSTVYAETKEEAQRVMDDAVAGRIRRGVSIDLSRLPDGYTAEQRLKDWTRWAAEPSK